MSLALAEYVTRHTERGECNCGRCLDRGEAPDPTGHVADLAFFKVAATGSPTLADFRQLTSDHKGEFNEVDPFDGREHNYLELGGWLGDQGAALRYMGLGVLLGAFRLLSPKEMLPGITDEQAIQMAGMGLLAVQSEAGS